MKVLTIKTRKLVPLFALALSLGMNSCGDESEGRVEVDNSAPAQVSDVNSTSGPGEVTLTWKIPSSPSFMYSQVDYKNSKGEEVSKFFSKDHAKDGMMTATIGGFATVNPVDFSIYACSVKGNHLEASKITATPGAPAFLSVANTLDVASAYGGAEIRYDNTTVASVIVNVKYHLKSDASKSGTATFTISPNTKGGQIVSLPVGNSEFVNGDNAVVEVATADVDGNGTEFKSFDVYIKKVKPIDRSNWSFPGYEDNYNPQFGYSSQEAGGEGASPKGRVLAMLDGDEGTFWHTAWKQKSSYPHFFIIDMGEEHFVTNYTIRRRTDNNKTNVGQTFYTCPASEANGTNPEGWGWTVQGWNKFNNDINDHQIFSATKQEKARYVKVYFAEKDKGGDFVMVSEFNVYEPAE